MAKIELNTNLREENEKSEVIKENKNEAKKRRKNGKNRKRRRKQDRMGNGDRSKRTTDNEQTWSYYFENVRFFSAFFEFVLHLT